MPLVACPDCKTEVSDRAAACPKCAAPIAAPRAVTIEATGKRWKGLYLWAGAAALAAILTTNVSTILAIVFVLIALGLVVTARTGAWWHHG